MLLAILASAACAVVAFTAIPRLPDALGVPWLRAWTDWASEWAAPVPLAVTYPVPAFAVAALLGSLSLLGWMTRVRCQGKTSVLVHSTSLRFVVFCVRLVRRSPAIRRVAAVHQ